MTIIISFLVKFKRINLQNYDVKLDKNGNVFHFTSVLASQIIVEHYGINAKKNNPALIQITLFFFNANAPYLNTAINRSLLSEVPKEDKKNSRLFLL